MEKRYILSEEDIKEIIFNFLWDINRPQIKDLLEKYPKYFNDEDYTLWEE